MAKAIITIEDTETGSITVDIEFDPSLETAECETTNAQMAGFQLFKSLPMLLGEENSQSGE